MNELQAALKIVLANTYVMYFKAQSYHWNVEGPNFSDYHAFFGTLYAEVYGAVDPIAERIRIVGGYAPISFADVLTAKTTDEDFMRPTTYVDMFNNLSRTNAAVIESLKKARNVAVGAEDHGLVDFLQERLDVHAKHAWMLRSLAKPGA